jgi:hypothetical protein
MSGITMSDQPQTTNASVFTEGVTAMTDDPEFSDSIGTVPEFVAAWRGSKKPTKLSDFVAYWQLLQARAGLMLTFAALTATASGLTAPILPLQVLPRGCLPIPVYVAAVFLFVAVMNALYAIPISTELRREYFRRLEERNLEAPDYVGWKLQYLLVTELVRKQRKLTAALEALIKALLQLFLYISSSSVWALLVFVRHLDSRPRSDVVLKIGAEGLNLAEQVGSPFGLSATAVVITLLNAVVSVVGVVLFKISWGAIVWKSGRDNLLPDPIFGDDPI